MPERQPTETHRAEALRAIDAALDLLRQLQRKTAGLVPGWLVKLFVGRVFEDEVDESRARSVDEATGLVLGYEEWLRYALPHLFALGGSDPELVRRIDRLAAQDWTDVLTSMALDSSAAIQLSRMCRRARKLLEGLRKDVEAVPASGPAAPYR